MAGIALGILLIVALIVLVIVVPYCGYMIFEKAGLNPYLGLILLIPGPNAIVLVYLALVDWPVLSRKKKRKK
jgi:hypothetical protein